MKYHISKNKTYRTLPPPPWEGVGGRLLICFLLCLVQPGIAKVRLPNLVSDGMVLQRDCDITIWGFADPGEEINIRFLKKNHQAKADAGGHWKIALPPVKAGGPYTMTINDLEVKDILIGDVWLCSGQSNMETPVSRVMDLFAEEVQSYSNPMIRYIKIPLAYDFHGPQEDIRPVEWKDVTPEHALSFAAVPYFFARFLYEKTKVPIGLINSSVGGSPAEAWVSEEHLKDFPHYLNDKKICESDGYIVETQQLQSMRNILWNKTMNEGDRGLKEKWANPLYDDSDWAATDMFARWGTDGLNLVNGSYWFRKTVDIPSHLAGREAVLRLGCIVDADSVFVNGTFVGATGYQYPPRIYQIPGNLLKAGKNNITIRLFSNGGRPHFVPDKPYKLLFGKEEISLEGEWKYRIGNRMLPMPGGVTFHYKATGLYNAMIAPLQNMALKGVLWYQGESNTACYNEYYSLMSALIDNWRNLWHRPDLPFILAQLPNFMPERAEPSESNWAELRDVQLKLSQSIPNTALGVNIDLGEWNDVHPLNKKDVGYRMALQAEKLLYGNKKIIADGPVYESYTTEGNKIILSFREGTNDFMPVDQLKGFAVAGSDGKFKWAEARIENGKVVVWNDEISKPVKVRYAWADNPGSVSLYNKAGLPASPFQMSVEARP